MSPETDTRPNHDKTFLKIRDEWYKRAADKAMTLETLPAFLKELAEFPHDYNTICYAVAAGAIASAWAMNRTPNGGITGFQAGAIMWEFMRAWNHVEAPAWLLKGEDLLYPQYAQKFNSISPDTFEWLKERAAKRIAEDGKGAHPDVIAHWRAIAGGQVPFGLQVRDS